MHFTPTSSFWMNMVERFFADLTQDCVRAGSFTSVAELVEAITVYLACRNENPKPYTWKASRDAHFLRPIGRLRPNVALAQAEEEADVVARRLEREYPNSNDGWRLRLQPLRDVLLGDIGPNLLILLAAVGFLWLIACVNVVNLVLARGMAQRRELATRLPRSIRALDNAVSDLPSIVHVCWSAPSSGAVAGVPPRRRHQARRVTF